MVYNSLLKSTRPRLAPNSPKKLSPTKLKSTRASTHHASANPPLLQSLRQPMLHPRRPIRPLQKIRPLWLPVRQDTRAAGVVEICDRIGHPGEKCDSREASVHCSVFARI